MMKPSYSALTLSIAAAFTLLFSACAAAPKLYPNEKYKSVGKEVAESDIKECQSEADNYAESGKGGKIARGAGSGAAVGAAVGGVSGLFGGGFGRGLLTGAAVGGAAGGTAAAVSPDQIKRQYVNRCLSGKGYEVLGWE